MTFEEEFKATLEQMEQSLSRIQLCVLALRRLQSRMREQRPEATPKEEHG